MAVNPQHLAQLLERISQALPERPADSELPPARFALLLKQGSDPIAAADEIRRALSEHTVKVEPLSTLEPDLLILTFPKRLMTPDAARAFQIAYGLTDTFRLANAEPEIFTDLNPEPDPTREGSPHESVDDFPPGCWAPEDSDIDNDTFWAIELMRVPEAWAYSQARHRPQKGDNIVIAQPDTGVTSHPELQGISRVSSYDFLDKDDDPTDPMDYMGNPGHGSGTASVALSGEQGKIKGSAPSAKHMPLRAIRDVRRISQISVAEAINFAVENGAHVITMSLGGLPSFSLSRAIRKAIAADVIVLAAAGNCVKTVVYPARYDHCLAVAGVNRTEEMWRGTCRGPDVDISAPAENVYRAKAEMKNGAPAFHAGQGQGTSFAVALTAGVAALWLAHHGRANVMAAARTNGESVQAMFRRMLRATSRRPGNGWDSTRLGAGIVDAESLLQADFAAGSDTESIGLLIGTREEGSLRRLVLDVTGDPEAAQADIDWDRFGPEIALALLKRQRGVVPPRRGAEVPAAELAAVAHPALSEALESALGKAPELASGLGQE